MKSVKALFGNASHFIIAIMMSIVVLVLVSTLQIFVCDRAYADDLTIQATGSYNIGSVTLAFDANGGKFDNGASIYNYGSATLWGSSRTSTSGTVDASVLTGMQQRVSREGWVFSGWYDAAEGGNKYTSSSVFAKSSKRTLYAHWKCEQYSVLYDVNEGAFPPGVSAPLNLIVSSGTSFADIEKPGMDPVRENYDFYGWGISKGSKSPCDDTYVPGPPDGSSEFTFYALWKVAKYTAIYDAAGGVFSSNEPTIVSQPTKVGQMLQLASFPSEEPRRPGYTFNGWWSSQTGGVGISANTVPSFAIGASCTLTYYAQWIGNPTTVTFDATGGAISGAPKYTMNATCGSALGSVPANPVKEHYSFAGWYDAEQGGNPVNKNTICAAPDAVYYAHWNPVEYSVSFSNSEGDDPYAQYVAYGSYAKAPEDVSSWYGNHVLDGWYLDQECTQRFSFDAPIAGSVRLYSKWRYPICTLRFDPNGGTGTVRSFVARGQYVELPETGVSREGYWLTGWSKSRVNSSGYGNWGYEPKAADEGKIITLYAIWEKDPYYVSPRTQLWRMLSSLGTKIYYGDKYVSGETGYFGNEFFDSYEIAKMKDALVTVKVKKKTYRGRVNRKGNFKVKAPKLAKCRIGTRVTVSVSAGGMTKTRVYKVKRYMPDVEMGTVYSTETKAYITLSDLTKGDVLKLKIGNKTYKKKVKKSVSKLDWNPKISRPKAGSRIRLTIVNRFKQKLGTYKDKVYSDYKVRMGMTKREVRLVPGYESPDSKSSGSGITYYSYTHGHKTKTIWFDNGRVYDIETYKW